jgi:hypothetical protein
MSLKTARFSLMLSGLLALAPSGTLVAAEPPAPPRSPEALARELIAATGGGNLGKQVAVQMIGALRGKNQEVPEEFWTEFLAGIDPRQLEDLVVPIYVKSLTVEEMTAAIEFFNSPLGRSFVSKQLPMMQESMAAGQAWGQLLAKQASERLAEHPAVVKANAEREAQRKTVGDLRNVGTAMLAWLTDHDGGGPATLPCAGELAIFGSDCPLATHAQVAAALVPTYIDEVPEKDAWGNPYQFLLDLERGLIGMRSPGQDGKYERDAYSSSKFPPAELDRDLVWRNGFFVRWPQS